MNPDGTNVLKITNAAPISGFNSDYLNFSWNTSGAKLYIHLLISCIASIMTEAV
jgi:hypothetical protein